MLLGLLAEAFFKHLENLVDALFRIALLAQKGAELLKRVFRVVEPVHQLVRQQLLGEGHVLEILQKRGVKLVVVRLALDEHGAAEVVKPVSVERCSPSDSPSMSVIHSLSETPKPR